MMVARSSAFAERPWAIYRGHCPEWPELHTVATPECCVFVITFTDALALAGTEGTGA